jgi:tripartite-type tricarboxylate transporter receptor subunit TctC
MKKFVLAALMSAAFAAGAQDYPSRAIQITVPNPPGGMNQIHAQPLSVVLEKLSGQPAPIINRPGGVAAAGTAYVANQKPDGYNILVTTPNSFLVMEKDKLYGVKSPYSLDQLALLALLSADPLFLTVHPSLPVKSVKELVALAKSKPNEIVYSSSGAYGIIHVPIEMFLQATGLKMRHLPTTGGGPAVTQALGGHAQVTAGGLAAVYPYLAPGKLRAIANMGAKPAAAQPNVPTLRSMNLDVEAYLWVGLFTTGGTPAPILTKMRELIGKVANDPLFKQALENAQVVPDYRDAPEFKKFFDADYLRLAAAVKKIGRLEDAK